MKVILIFLFLTFFLIPFHHPFFANQAELGGPQIGWITFHFLHANFFHWLSNAFGLLILGWLSYSFYPKTHLLSLTLIFLGTGPLLSLIAQEGYHIGASGIVYGLFHYLLGLSLYHRNKKDLVIFCILALLFSGMIWAPLAEPGISWQGHTAGAIMGWVAFFVHVYTQPQITTVINSHRPKDLLEKQYQENSRP